MASANNFQPLPPPLPSSSAPQILLFWWLWLQHRRWWFLNRFGDGGSSTVSDGGSAFSDNVGVSEGDSAFPDNDRVSNDDSSVCNTVSIDPYSNGGDSGNRNVFVFAALLFLTCDLGETYKLELLALVSASSTCIERSSSSSLSGKSYYSFVFQNPSRSQSWNLFSGVPCLGITGSVAAVLASIDDLS